MKLLAISVAVLTTISTSVFAVTPARPVIPPTSGQLQTAAVAAGGNTSVESGNYLWKFYSGPLNLKSVKLVPGYLLAQKGTCGHRPYPVVKWMSTPTFTLVPLTDLFVGKVNVCTTNSTDLHRCDCQSIVTYYYSARSNR